ncbi:lactate racemase domain-containing protein [Ruminococcaceae bacterium OttesenSCG-928-I18]|nr:lactate racemase domain-containing protein [Ruminococcaceae bacterium OttesenSCG-928-I18]
MRYHLPANNLYGDEPIEICFPDHWEVHISEIRGFDTPELSEEQIRESLASPIGTARVKEGARGKKSAVIIIDDITRPTPCEAIAKAVIAELLQAGVPKENIWFVAALGAHGVMYKADFVRKLGEELVEEFEVHNHNVFFNHVYLGNTSHNVPVEINADVMAADYKIAIGTSMAHGYYGFGGGAKCILPGVASMRTITSNHSFTTPSDFNMGNPETLMREDAEQAARMMGLDFKVDVVINGHGKICKLYAGDFEAEAKECRKYAAEHYSAPFVADCDVVLSNSYLKPAEACCAYTPEVIASLKPGGDFILAGNTPFGSCVHFLYDKWGKTSPGGMLWAGCYTKKPEMENAIVFAQHSVKGMRDAWYIDENSGAVYEKCWENILKIIDRGSPRKVVVYPMGEAQVLDNSHEFYPKEPPA